MNTIDQMIINMAVSIIYAALAAIERAPENATRRVKLHDEIRAALQTLEKYANK